MIPGHRGLTRGRGGEGKAVWLLSRGVAGENLAKLEKSKMATPPSHSQTFAQPSAVGSPRGRVLRKEDFFASPDYRSHGGSAGVAFSRPFRVFPPKRHFGNRDPYGSRVGKRTSRGSSGTSQGHLGRGSRTGTAREGSCRSETELGGASAFTMEGTIGFFSVYRRVPLDDRKTHGKKLLPP